jgi:3-methyladenine DNA glycosylase AlkD
MKLAEVMSALEKLGTEQVRKIWGRHGAKEPYFGVKFGDLYGLRKKIGSDGALADALWKTGNADGRNLALLIAVPETAPLERWGHELDWSAHASLLADLAAKTPGAAKLQKAWTASKSDLVSSTGWATLCSRLKVKAPVSEAEGRAALKAIEQGIHRAPNRTRHAMNMALCAVGIWMPGLRKDAIAVAGRIGKVEVDHGETGCKTPDAAAYIRKAAQRVKTSR